MSNTSLKIIKDLIIFYVKENYNAYCVEQGLKYIQESDLDNVIDILYTQKKFTDSL